MEPGIKVYALEDGTTCEYELNTPPDVIAIGQGLGTHVFQNPIEWTTLNGGITAFRVERGKELFIVFDIFVETTTPPDAWYAYIYVRTSRFQ